MGDTFFTSKDKIRLMPDKIDDQFVKITVEKLKSKNPTIICGFPGMGLVGNIVVQYLIDQLKMKVRI